MKLKLFLRIWFVVASFESVLDIWFQQRLLWAAHACLELKPRYNLYLYLRCLLIG